MKVTTALLCDAATVRENLLSVLSGGITRIWRPEFPSPMGVSLALMLEIHPTEFEKPHEIRVQGIGEDGEQVFEVRGAFQRVALEGDEAGESSQFPVILDLRNVTLPAPGPYDINVVIDGEWRLLLAFKASIPQDTAETQR